MTDDSDRKELEQHIERLGAGAINRLIGWCSPSDEQREAEKRRLSQPVDFAKLDKDSRRYFLDGFPGSPAEYNGRLIESSGLYRRRKIYAVVQKAAKGSK